MSTPCAPPKDARNARSPPGSSSQTEIVLPALHTGHLPPLGTGPTGRLARNAGKLNDGMVSGGVVSGRVISVSVSGPVPVSQPVRTKASAKPNAASIFQKSLLFILITLLPVVKMTKPSVQNAPEQRSGTGRSGFDPEGFVMFVGTLKLSNENK